jgi:hypothetical protein
MYADGGCGDGELRTAGCGYLWRYRDRGEEAVEGGGVELFEASKTVLLERVQSGGGGKVHRGGTTLEPVAAEIEVAFLLELFQS